jgi:hypothetical protein
MRLQRHRDSHRKSMLVAIGQWVLTSDRGWLVRAVEGVLEREGLRE